MSILKSGRPSSHKEKAIKQVLSGSNNTIRMNINIDKDFYREIKKHAINNDITIKDFVQNALKNFMAGRL